MVTFHYYEKAIAVFISDESQKTPHDTRAEETKLLFCLFTVVVLAREMISPEFVDSMLIKWL